MGIRFIEFGMRRGQIFVSLTENSSLMARLRPKFELATLALMSGDNGCSSGAGGIGRRGGIWFESA